MRPRVYSLAVNLRDAPARSQPSLRRNHPGTDTEGFGTRSYKYLYQNDFTLQVLQQGGPVLCGGPACTNKTNRISGLDPTIGLCLGSQGDPRRVGIFLWARYPRTIKPGFFIKSHGTSPFQTHGTVHKLSFFKLGFFKLSFFISQQCDYYKTLLLHKSPR